MKCRNCQCRLFKSFFSELDITKIKCKSCGSEIIISKMTSYLMNFFVAILIAGVFYYLDFSYIQAILAALLLGGVVSRFLIYYFGLYK